MSWVFLTAAVFFTFIGVSNDMDGRLPRNWTMFAAAALLVVAGFQ